MTFLKSSRHLKDETRRARILSAVGSISFMVKVKVFFIWIEIKRTFHLNVDVVLPYGYYFKKLSRKLLHDFEIKIKDILAILEFFLEISLFN